MLWGRCLLGKTFNFSNKNFFYIHKGINMSEGSDAKKIKLGDAETLVKEQLEYYFGDSNYRRDKWMKSTAAENGGYIPVEKLLDFKKLANLLNEHGKDLAFLVETIKTLDSLELSEDEKLVKRKYPLPENDDSKERTLVIVCNCLVFLFSFFLLNFSLQSGLPTDGEKVTIDSVKTFFSQHGEVVSVSLQKNKEKQLTGSAYIEVKTVEDAKKIAALEDITFEESKLVVKLKTEHDEERKALRQKEKEKKKLDDRKKDIVKGVLIKFNTEPFEGLEAIEIRKYFAENFGNVKFVDTNSTNEEKVGYVRFSDVESCQNAMKSIEAKEFKYKETPIEATLLEGEDEEKYWSEKVLSSTTQTRKKRKR